MDLSERVRVIAVNAIAFPRHAELGQGNGL
jgi:hypothetical protein